VWIRRAWQIPPVERLALGAEALRRGHALVDYLKLKARTKPPNGRLNARDIKDLGRRGGSRFVTTQEELGHEARNFDEAAFVFMSLAFWNST
jgi:hypothetical protein